MGQNLIIKKPVCIILRSLLSYLTFQCASYWKSNKNLEPAFPLALNVIRKRASRNVSNKNLACAGQLIITTPIQAVKLPTTTVTRFKIAFSLWPKLIRTVESEILAIKKTVKTYIQLLELYSAILNVPIKHVQEKWKGKEIWL